MKDQHLENEFIKLIQDNEKIIFKVCSAYVSDENPLADLYQDVVCNLWKSFAGFRNESSVSTWMYKVALNTCVTNLRRVIKKPQQVSISALSLHLADANELSEDIREMYRLIRRLSSLEKAIVLLYLDGRSYQEIAEITGLKPTTVGVRLMRVKESYGGYYLVNKKDFVPVKAGRDCIDKKQYKNHQYICYLDKKRKAGLRLLCHSGYYSHAYSLLAACRIMAVDLYDSDVGPWSICLYSYLPTAIRQEHPTHPTESE